MDLPTRRSGQALRTIESFFADRVIFSCKGIEQHGYLTDPDPQEAEVKHAMISRSRAVALVADTRKFEQHGLNVIVAASVVNVAYLADPPAPGVRRLESAGVAVTQV